MKVVGGGGEGACCAQLVMEEADKCNTRQSICAIKRTTIMCSVEDVRKINVLREVEGSKASVTLRFGKYMN